MLKPAYVTRMSHYEHTYSDLDLSSTVSFEWTLNFDETISQRTMEVEYIGRRTV
jgi:hypothetical protein